MKTDEILTNQKIKEKKIRLDWIIEGTEAATWEWDIQTGKTVFNDRWAQMLGYNLEDLSPTTIETWTNQVHPEDLKKAKKELTKHLNGETKKYNVEIRMKHRDGHWVWVNDRGKVVLWTEDNKPLKMFGIHIDISKRKEREKEIINQKKFLEGVMNNISDIVGIQHVDHRIEKYNKAGYDFLNISSEEARNQKCYELLGRDNECKPCATRKALKNRKKEQVEMYLAEKDVFLDCRSNPIFDKNGNIKWIVEQIRDITEEKNQERKTKKSEKRYRAIFNSAPNAIFIIDQFGDCKNVNLKAIKIFGYDRKEFLELNIKDIIAVDSINTGLEAINKLLKKGYVNTEVELLTKNNKTKNVILDAVYLSENRYLVFAKDITERKKQRLKLEFQYKFQRTLAEISSSLLETNKSNIDRKINMSLKKIGEFFKIDRSYIFQFEKESKQFFNTHEWCKTGIKSYKNDLQNIDAANFSWWMKKLYNNQIIKIKNVDEMQNEAAKNFLKKKNIKSIMVHPIFIADALFGFFGFESVQTGKEFSKEEEKLLKIFTDVITSAFSKYIDDKKIRNLTYKDPLTGLYNRRFLEEELARLDTQRQLPISIIVADINGLKIVNDSLGHKKGDQLLKKSAEILKEVIREEDILARQGGDEFAILLPKTETKKAEGIIKRIKKESSKTKNEQLTVTMALGTAAKTYSKQKIEEVLKAADNDMYQNKLSESKSTKSKIVHSLLNTLEVKSNETKEHALRMTKLAFDFGEKLELSNSELNRLSLLSTLHDIGKTTIPEKILKKPGKLTDQEWKIMREHSERGYKIANSSEEFALVAKEIYAHHENWDGSGYPRKLKGKDIPYLARIISIIDAYDVMINDRPYSKAISKEKALQEIKSGAGSQFDPELAALFIEIMENNN